MNPTPPDMTRVGPIVSAALREDLGETGDITSQAVVPEDLTGTAHVVARADLVVAGLAVAREVFRQLDPSVSFQELASEGERVGRGHRLASVSGSARAILAGERTALNFLMRMCGIAGAARAAVEEVRSSGAIILDTRKTAPGLRLIDKWAVAAGGGTNHRLGLHDAAMIKDTHLAIVGSVTEAVRRALAAGIEKERITAEVRTLGELEEAIAAGAGRALLDNMDLDTLREAVRLGKGRIVLEASGGLRPGNLKAAASTGVDFLSLGWLTHSAPAADIAMEMEFRA